MYFNILVTAFTHTHIFRRDERILLCKFSVIFCAPHSAAFLKLVCKEYIIMVSYRFLPTYMYLKHRTSIQMYLKFRLTEMHINKYERVQNAIFNSYFSSFKTMRLLLRIIVRLCVNI